MKPYPSSLAGPLYLRAQRSENLQVKKTAQKKLHPCHLYSIDDMERVRPVHEMGWVIEAWMDKQTFDEAITAAAGSLHIDDAFRDNKDELLTSEDWDWLQAIQYLDIEDGFFLATGVDMRLAVFRFRWGKDVFFSMRPDFGFVSLGTMFGAEPINMVESEIRDRALGNALEAESMYRAIKAGEIDPMKSNTLEWWLKFWSRRGFTIHNDSVSHSDCKEGELSLGDMVLSGQAPRSEGTTTSIATAESLSDPTIVSEKPPKERLQALAEKIAKEIRDNKKEEPTKTVVAKRIKIILSENPNEFPPAWWKWTQETVERNISHTWEGKTRGRPRKYGA
jgi:hypothetical protein